MSNPSVSAIQTAAQQGGVTQSVAYAYAAQNGYLPNDGTTLQAYLANVAQWSKLLGGIDPEYVLAYITENGQLPQAGQFQIWMHQAGYTDASGALTGQAPYPGEGYTPGPDVVPVQQVPIGTPTIPAIPSLSGLTDFWTTNQKPLLIGGGLILGFTTGIIPDIIRGLRRAF